MSSRCYGIRLESCVLIALAIAIVVGVSDAYSRLVPRLDNLDTVSEKIYNQGKKIDYINKTLDELRDFLSDFTEMIEARIS